MLLDELREGDAREALGYLLCCTNDLPDLARGRGGARRDGGPRGRSCRDRGGGRRRHPHRRWRRRDRKGAQSRLHVLVQAPPTGGERRLVWADRGSVPLGVEREKDAVREPVQVALPREDPWVCQDGDDRGRYVRGRCGGRRGRRGGVSGRGGCPRGRASDGQQPLRGDRSGEGHLRFDVVQEVAIAARPPRAHRVTERAPPAFLGDSRQHVTQAAQPTARIARAAGEGEQEGSADVPVAPARGKEILRRSGACARPPRSPRGRGGRPSPASRDPIHAAGERPSFRHHVAHDEASFGSSTPGGWFSQLPTEGPHRPCRPAGVWNTPSS